MKQILMQMGMLLLLTTVGNGQPYEPEHLWGRPGEEPEDYFGSIIGGIGDVNGDGCEDFITSEAEPVSYTMVFFGGDPPDTTADILFHNPYPYGYFGGAWNVGDVNGDSWDDFAIQGGYQQENMHRVFLFFGGNVIDTIPDVVLSEGEFWDGFGNNIQGVGDVNGDEYDDLAINATSYPWHDQYGKVWIYFGGSTMDSIADWEQQGSNQHVRFGQSIAGKGDLNEDGYDDFAVYEWTNYPQLDGSAYYVYYGSIELDTIPDLVIEAWNYSPEVNISTPAAIIGNLNGDPYSDLVIAAGRTTNAVVFYGGDPMDTEIDLILGGFDPNPDNWNMNVSAAGDVNADGYDDIIVGQYESDLWGAGRVLVYLGSPWMDGQPDMRWIGSFQPWWGCGISLADCGDINGDGVDDIMFGSLHGDNRGRIDIWEGDSAFVANVPERRLEPIPQKFPLFPPYPSPFNNTLIIPFEIYPGGDRDLHLKIYNVLGREVVDLSEEVRKAMSGQLSGSFDVTWNAFDGSGQECSSGIYLVMLESNSVRHVQKAVLLR